MNENEAQNSIAIKCPICGGAEFDGEDKRLMANGKIFYSPRGFFGLFTGLELQPRACLNCGFVATFVDSAKLRKMARKN